MEDMPTLNLTSAQKKQKKRLDKKRDKDDETLSETLEMIKIALAFEKEIIKSLDYTYHVGVLAALNDKINSINLAKLILKDIQVKNNNDGDKLEINAEVFLCIYVLYLYQPLLFSNIRL